MADSVVLSAPESRPLPSGNFWFWAFVAVSNLLYVFVAVHTPININPGAPHDDTLFMDLGRYLANGRWLGPYTEFTLVKGPGYPAFLALASLFGLSVTLATALLHCFAITLLVVLCRRFIRSLWLSALLLFLLLWHPVSLSLHLLRILREALYYNQVLLFLALSIGALFVAKSSTSRLTFAALAGVAFGWVWLTREEGIWLIPGVLLLLGVGAMYAAVVRQIRPFLHIVGMAVALFAATNVAFRTANFIAYGSFIGVDFKEANYQRALRAIHGVRSGGTLPSISITKGARERVYAISPAFASLKDYFEGPPALSWSGHSCTSVKIACETHEIGPGHFIFALRNAAAVKGHYRSPAAASAFFGQIANEINAACASGQLECQAPLINELTPLTWGDILRRVPAHMMYAANIYLFRDPPLSISPSGNVADVAGYLRFLNFPRYELPAGFAPSASYHLSGWYYRSGDAWFTPIVKKDNGMPVDLDIKRNGSPDIAAMTKNADAANQRFLLQTTCDDTCTLEFAGSDGVTVSKTLAAFRNGSIGFDVGSGHVNVDVTTAITDPAFVTTRADNLARHIREFDLKFFQNLYLPLQAFGLIAFIVATLFRWRRAPFNVCYVLALTSWVFAFSRGMLLAIVGAAYDTTVMSNAYYGAPVFFHLVCGTVLSIAACLQLFGWRAERQTTLPA